MFRSIVWLTLLCLPLIAEAQSKAIDDFYNAYQGQKDISRLEIKGGILNLVAHFSDESEAKELVRKVTRLRVLDIEQGGLVSTSQRNQLVRSVRRDRFEDLMQIRDNGDDIHIMVREQEGFITDILVLIHGADEFTLLSLEGRLRFKDLQHLELEFEGGEHLKKVPANPSGKADPERA